MFSAPSILHHLVNTTAISILFLDKSHAQSLVEPQFILLAMTSVSLFALVQWEFKTQLSSINACVHATTMLNAINKGSDVMEAMHLRLCLFRFVMVALYFGSLLWNLKSTLASDNVSVPP